MKRYLEISQPVETVISEEDQAWAEFAENVGRSRGRDSRSGNNNMRWAGVVALLLLVIGMSWFVWGYVHNKAAAAAKSPGRFFCADGSVHLGHRVVLVQPFLFVRWRGRVARALPHPFPSPAFLLRLLSESGLSKWCGQPQANLYRRHAVVRATRSRAVCLRRSLRRRDPYSEICRGA